MIHGNNPFSGPVPRGERDLHSARTLPLTRREFTKVSLLAMSGAALLPLVNRLGAAEAASAPSGKPDSKFAGVQIGLNVPYSFADMLMSGEDILKNCVQLGVSAVELRIQPVEVFLGAPAKLVNSERAAGQKEELAQLRKSAPMDRVKEFRDNYEAAGVFIEIVKVDGIFKMTDDEIDYAFTLAKTLGGRAMSTEISRSDSDLQRIGKFADKHEMMIGYHGHASTKPEHWERAFSFAKCNGANVDLGHFVAGDHGSPIPFLEKHHDRVTHVHLKDRKIHNGPNTPFGEGDTPIAEALRVIRDNRWNIQATIEFEYDIPAGSNRMAELARAIRYCREALA